MRTPTCTCALLCALVFPTSLPAAETEIEGLIARIRSADDAVRLQARLEAPRHGAAVIPHLAEVWERGDLAASRTARFALTEVIHHAGRPGSTRAERAAVAKELVRLLSTDHSETVRRETLYEIASVGDGSVVSAVAACLDDSGREVAQTARLALERIPGPESVAALREAAEKASGDRKPDLLFSLGKKGDRAVVPYLLREAGSTEDATRVAAFTALAHLGARDAVAPLRALLADAATPSRTSLFVEFQRLADNLSATGEYELAREMHAFVLKTAPAEASRERALLRLCPPGDPSNVGQLLVGLGDPSTRVRRSAMRVLTTLEGPEVATALQRGYEEAAPSGRPIILRAIAERDRSAAEPLLEAAAAGESAELKITALDILGKLDDPSLERVYLRVAREGSEHIRPVAARGCLALAERALGAGETSKALALFRASLELVSDVDLRRSALAGLAAVGDPSVIDEIEPLLEDPSLAVDAAGAYIAFAAKIGASGQADRAEEKLLRIVSGRFPRDVIVRAGEELTRLGRDPQKAARQGGFVLDWWLIGPILDLDGKGIGTRLFPEERIRLDVVERIGPRRYRWQRLRDLCLDGMVDLVPLFRRSSNVIAYGYTVLVAEEDMDVLFKMGSDDGMACFVNDERIHYRPQPRGYRVDEDTVKVRLRKGENKVMVKIAQTSGVWAFSLRTTDMTGKALQLPVRLPGRS